MNTNFRQLRFKDFKKFLSESLLIVFSVLFALFINKCQGDARETARTEEILLNIQKELEQNQTAVQRLVRYHTGVLERLKKVPKDSLEQLFFRDTGFVIYDNAIAPMGISQEVFKDIAWATGVQEDISSRISFEKAQRIFEVYGQQETVWFTITQLINTTNDRETHRRELIQETMGIIQQAFEEMLSQELQLLQQYEIVLEEFT